MNTTQNSTKSKIVKVIGVDLAKDHCDVIGYDENGKICLRKLFKNPRAKPDGTKMFCSAFLNDARMCCFFANAIVKY